MIIVGSAPCAVVISAVNLRADGGHDPIVRYAAAVECRPARQPQNRDLAVFSFTCFRGLRMAHKIVTPEIMRVVDAAGHRRSIDEFFWHTERFGQLVGRER